MECYALVFSVILLVTVTHQGDAVEHCAAVTDRRVSKKEGQVTRLECDVTNKGSSKIQWIRPDGTLVSTDCQSTKTGYSVECAPVQNPNKFTLVFNSTWANRGDYACVCLSNRINMTVTFNVKVPPTSIDTICTVRESGQACSQTSRKGSDVLEFKAIVGCAYPSATVTWTDDMGAPIDTSKFGGKLKTDVCTGGLSGQKSMISTFSSTWADLGKPVKLTVSAANEAGGDYVDLTVHKPAEKEDTTLVIVGAVIGVALFLVIMGLVVYLVIRHKKKSSRYV